MVPIFESGRSEATANLQQEVRAALRGLKPAGGKRTLAELREVMTQHICDQRLASMGSWTPQYIDLHAQLDSIGMSVAAIYHNEREYVEPNWLVMWPDKLLKKHPEFLIYESVLMRLTL